MDFGLENKRVFVSASSKGIGKATAELFLKEGCKVAISSSNQQNLDKAVEELKSKYGVEPVSVVCDINNPVEIKNAVAMINNDFGDIDILVNNCGGPLPGTMSTLDDENWKNGFEQVLMSAVRFSREVLPAMKQNKWGRIINITSLSVKQPVENLMLSNSFRTGLTAFAKTLSNEVGLENITVNNVAPGFTLTERLEELADLRAKETGISREEQLKNMGNSVPMKRIAIPEEVASAVVFLASEQAGYITGQTLPVDGGAIKGTF